LVCSTGIRKPGPVKSTGENPGMKLFFSKYHGAGNDFIIIDNRKKVFAPLNDREQSLIASLCHRRYGIGADGLILIEKDASADFMMHYFNSDGRKGSLCGNGSRCAAAFAYHTIFPGRQQMRFNAVDGIHEALVITPHPSRPFVSVTLNPAKKPVNIAPDNYFVNTGSPHLVRFVRNLDSVDVVNLGRQIRHAREWAPEGINVNFVEDRGNNTLSVRTYERGVEDETLSCGTGVTAAAIAAWSHHHQDPQLTDYITLTSGGKLEVSFQSPDNHLDTFSNVRLKGPVQFVFSGELDIEALKQAITTSDEPDEQ